MYFYVKRTKIYGRNEVICHHLSVSSRNDFLIWLNNVKITYGDTYRYVEVPFSCMKKLFKLKQEGPCWLNWPEDFK